MHTLVAAVVDVTIPVVIGLSAVGILVLALGYVRQLGKSRPHAK